MNKAPEKHQILSVSQLNQNVGQLLEQHLPKLWVEGEISNLSRPTSGHFYFTLKDQNAQVRCAMFRNSQKSLTFSLKNGLQVLVRCRAGIYAGRGDYQLIIQHMEEAGFGILQRKFEELKHRLDKEGLFATNSKTQIPRSIQHIGIITSPSGAAIRDILAVLARRSPYIKVSIYPSLVQGERAAKNIANAIQLADSDNRCDVLLLSRGGGSLEDLWPFNEESVARAISSCQLPLISAIGHEIDFTIADFVSDHRAATPSAAAELLSPDSQKILKQFVHMEQQLIKLMKRRTQNLHQTCDLLSQRLKHPSRKLADQTNELTNLSKRLFQSVNNRLERKNLSFNSISTRLKASQPNKLITASQKDLSLFLKRLHPAIIQQLARFDSRFNQALTTLDAFSPVKTLGRGYSVLKNEQGTVIKSTADVAINELVSAQVVDGEIFCSIKKVTNNVVNSLANK